MDNLLYSHGLTLKQNHIFLYKKNEKPKKEAKYYDPKNTQKNP